jgi:Zn-dependent protease with chaperone function
MFGYAIYYIVALLIYSTYQPLHYDPLSISQSSSLLASFFLLFACVSRWQFKKIESQIESLAFRRIDHQFHATLTRQSIFTILLYAVDIYLFNLQSIVNRFTVFQKVPTFEALFFLLLFVSHLAVVWNNAYGPYQKIYRTGITKKEYIVSNISFSVPILLPWFILSLTVDLIHSLPFETPRRFLLSVEGQALYFVCFLLVVAIVGPAFIQKFWQCRSLDNGYIRHRIESMCAKAEMGFNDILIWPLFGGKIITAGVMGLIRQFRYILVTPALIDLLDPVEIDAVIAHEIGHIKLKHLLFYLCLFVGYILIAFALMDLIVYLLVYLGASYGLILHDLAKDSFSISIVLSFTTIFIFLIYFRYIFGFFMRNFERQADIFAYTAIGSAQPLISTFEKISLSSGQSPDKPNWHHFSIHERISYLRKCASDRKWIDRHNLKIKKSFWAYMIVMVALGGMGLFFHYGETRKTIHSNLVKKIIFERIKVDPINADLHQFVGDLYYSEKQYGAAAASYERALKINPHHVHALNNLAWMYATCDVEGFRMPQKALELALHASTLSKEAHILDTLAEAYYVNGDWTGAVNASEKALSSATQNELYFRDQLERFKNAAHRNQSH